MANWRFKIDDLLLLDTSYIEPYIDLWLEDLSKIGKQQQNERIKKKDLIVPYIAISASIMKTVSIIADHLILEPQVKYMAIHLFDAFMCKRWEFVSSLANCEMIWTRILEEHFKFTELHLVSCFQLAYKMGAKKDEPNLGISQIFDVLHLISEKEYTKNMILCSEIEVLKTVDYKIPLDTPFHCIQILMAATGLTKLRGTNYFATSLLDLLYLKFDVLFSQFNLSYAHTNTWKIQKKLASLKSNMLFLSAAVVLCTMYFVYSGRDILYGKIFATKLAELSNTSLADIVNMSLLLLQASDPVESSRSRKSRKIV